MTEEKGDSASVRATLEKLEQSQLGEQLRQAVLTVATLAAVSADRVAVTQDYDSDENVWLWSVSIRYTWRTPRGRRDYTSNAHGCDVSLVKAAAEAIERLKFLQAT